MSPICTILVPEIGVPSSNVVRTFVGKFSSVILPRTLPTLRAGCARVPSSLDLVWWPHPNSPNSANRVSSVLSMVTAQLRGLPRSSSASIQIRGSEQYHRVLLKRGPLQDVVPPRWRDTNLLPRRQSRPASKVSKLPDGNRPSARSGRCPGSTG
jgi:hypothetical protein